MERLTYDLCFNRVHCWQIKGADNKECREVCENQDDLEGCRTCPIAKAFDRLADIENILGDTYDLDMLKELVEAYKDGRCVVLPKWENTVSAITAAEKIAFAKQTYIPRDQWQDAEEVM